MGNEVTLEKIMATLERVEKEIQGVKERLYGVEKEIHGVKERLDGVEKEIHGVKERLDGVEKNYNLLSNEINIMKRVNEYNYIGSLGYRIKQPLQSFSSASFIGENEEVNSFFKF